MRLVLLLALVSACGFEVASGTPHDARPDTPPDQVNITWKIDATSKKAVPANATEWRDFLTAKNVAIQPPSSLWLMQETNGQLADSIGSVFLAPFGTGVSYTQTVAGWSRQAVTTTDGLYGGFDNMSDPTLPNVVNTSMTTLVLVGFPSTPAAQRNFLVQGSSSPAAYGHVDLDNGKRLSLSISATTASGTQPMNTAPMAILVEFDVKDSKQKVMTRGETVNLPYTALGSSRGLFIGGGTGTAPETRFLYMASWYGANAELSDAQAQALLAALDW